MEIVDGTRGKGEAFFSISAGWLSILKWFRHFQNKIPMFSLPELLNILSKSAFDSEIEFIMFKGLSNGALPKNGKES